MRRDDPTLVIVELGYYDVLEAAATITGGSAQHRDPDQQLHADSFADQHASYPRSL